MTIDLTRDPWSDCDLVAVRVPDPLESPMQYVIDEIRRQDVIHPRGFGHDRDGIRSGIAAIQDELEETLDAWRSDKRRLHAEDFPWLGEDSTEGELVQTIAVALRLLRSIHDGAGPSRGDF